MSRNREIVYGGGRIPANNSSKGIVGRDERHQRSAILFRQLTDASVGNRGLHPNRNLGIYWVRGLPAMLLGRSQRHSVHPPERADRLEHGRQIVEGLSTIAGNNPEYGVEISYTTNAIDPAVLI